MRSANILIDCTAVAALAVAAYPVLCAEPQGNATRPATDTLYLEVFLNGFDRGLIVQVDREGDRLYVSADDLDAAGLRVDYLQTHAGRIALADMPGITFRYAPLEQRLYFTAAPASLKTQFLGGAVEATTPPHSDLGVVFDYSLYAQSERTSFSQHTERLRAPRIDSGYGRTPLIGRSAVGAAYENRNRAMSMGTNLRVFSPVGLFNNYGHMTAQSDEYDYTRDETFWTYSALDPMRDYTVGDFIDSSLSWTRSLRMGGVRVARNFDVNPDLVTFPTPVLGGTAVVPTTVDLYVNGIRQLSSHSNPGPFLLQNPPALTGAGLVNVVYQDALGRQVSVAQPLYVDNRMLERGLFDYALEFGYARRNYGSESFDYASHSAATASWRYGLTNALTLEAHGEFGEDLYNGGVGGLLALGRFGVLSAAAAYSDGDATGMLTSAGYQYLAPRWSIDLYDRRTHGDYRDLGSLEGIPVPQRLTRGAVTLSFARTHSLTLSYAEQLSSQFGVSRVVSLGYNATWWNSRVSTFANAFQDRGADDAVGGFIGVYVSIDDRTGVYSNASHYAGDDTVAVGASRPADYDLGGFGWNASMERGSDDYRRGLARLDYRSRYGDWALLVDHAGNAQDDYTNTSLYGTGSFAYMQGEFLASRTIYDGFALVSTRGLPDVPVLRENRLLGRTNEHGFLLVNDLPSYRVSHLAISPTELPIDVKVADDRMSANPRARSGVLIEFPVDRYRGATLVLVDAQGVPLLPGVRVILDSGESALTGYDGQVFFPDLQPSNHVTAELDDGACEAEVPFATAQVMQVIGPFVCSSTDAP